MTTKNGLAAVLAAITGKQPADEAIARADHMTAIETAVTQAFGEGETAGKAAGMTAERTRITAILGSEEAKGRESFAQVYAFETDMSAEAATTALKTKPKAEAPRAASRLDALMPANNPSLKDVEPRGSNDDLGASLNAAVDNLTKSRGLTAH